MIADRFSPMTPEAPRATARAIAPRLLWMSAAYRRSAIYVFVGSLLVVAVGIAVSRFVGRPLESCWPLVMFPVGGCGVVLLAFLWRMRIDERGVAVRTLFRWREWLWDDMFAGRIAMRSLLKFEHSGRKLLGRMLNLEYLEPADSHNVSRLCRMTCLQPPTVMNLPDEMLFRDQWNRTVRCTAGGMHLPGRGAVVVPWQSVLQARIARVAREATDFHKLEIQLPDRTIVATASQQLAVRDVNDLSLITAWLTAHIPTDRLSLFSLGDPPESLKEAEALLADNEIKLLSLRRVLFWFPIFGAAMLVYCLLTGLLHMIPVTILMVAMYQYIFWLMGSPFRNRHRLLESAKESLLAGRPPDASNPAWTMIRA